MKSSTEKEWQQRPSIIISGFSLACMGLVLSVLVAWNDGTILSGRRRIHRTSSRIPTTIQRTLAAANEEMSFSSQSDVIDLTDDATRSATCKHYLYNFLNGTTDMNDECEAFKNAFNAADCKDDTLLGTWSSNFKKRNQSANDDLYIDDFFENWEVGCLYRRERSTCSTNLTHTLFSSCTISFVSPVLRLH